MNPQTTHADEHVEPRSALIERAERDADETLDRLTRAREDADTPDDAAAEQAWRQIARLSSRLHTQAHAIVVTLEGGAGEQRDRVAESLLHCPDRSARALAQ